MPQFLGSPYIQYFNATTGQPYSGGKVYFYAHGTQTPINTYQSVSDANSQINANTNPVILDSAGKALVVISGNTDVALYDLNNNLVWTMSNGIGSGGSNITDSNGNNLLNFTQVASAINYVNITNAATGTTPIIGGTGADTNVGLQFTTKGTGVFSFVSNANTISLPSVTDTLVHRTGDTLTNATLITPKASTINDSNGNEILLLSPATTSVNYWQMTNAATTAPVVLAASGTDTNVGINIVTQAAGALNIKSNTLLNYFTFTPSATGSNPILSVAGDTNRDLNLQANGTGGINIKGRTDGGTGFANFVGETISSSVPLASQITMTNNTPVDITSISLPAGNWLVFGNVYMTVSTSTGAYLAWTSLTSATVPDVSLIAKNAAGATSSCGMPTPVLKLNLSATTTVYLSGEQSAVSGTAHGMGTIFAMRIY